jgi:hypothetical protein
MGRNDKTLDPTVGLFFQNAHLADMVDQHEMKPRKRIVFFLFLDCFCLISGLSLRTMGRNVKNL